MTKHLKVLYVLISFMLFQLMSSLISNSYAFQEILFEDDFTNGFEKWTPIRGNFNLWSINEGKARAELINQGTFIELVPKNQYWSNSIKSYEYELDYTPVTGIDKNIAFGVVDTGNWYQFHFTGGLLHLDKFVNSKHIWLYPSNFVIPNNQTYKIKIIFNEEIVQLYINGKLTIDAIDPTYNGETGKIALRVTNGSPNPVIVEFDNIVVRTISPEVPETPEPPQEPEVSPTPSPTTPPAEPQPFLKLILPFISQNEAPWGPLEYNSASNWVSMYNTTDSSFDRWACKLTSDVMVLKYHGITTLPDGTELNPLSYNNWLKTKYSFTNGIVPLGAVSDIASLINKQTQSSPNLEYKSYTTANSDNLKNTIISQLQAGKPSIVQLTHPNKGSHFVVATGIVDEQTKEIIINDPEEWKNTIEKYQEIGYSVSSVRTYQPSFTDLSNWFFSTNNLQAELTITNDKGEEIPTTQLLESINSPTAPLSSFPTQKVWEVTKPASGKYSMKITSPNNSPVTVSAILYDTQAHTKTAQLEVSPQSDEDEVEYSLTYFKTQEEGTSEIEEVQDNPPGTFYSFRSIILSYHKAGQITNPWLVNHLYDISLQAENGTTLQKLHAVRTLSQVMRAHSKDISKKANHNLQAHLIFTQIKLLQQHFWEVYAQRQQNKKP